MPSARSWPGSPESVTQSSYLVGMKTLTSTQVNDPVGHTVSEAIFDDPISYLHTYGIEAVLVVEPETSLPAAV